MATPTAAERTGMEVHRYGAHLFTHLQRARVRIVDPVGPVHRLRGQAGARCAQCHRPGRGRPVPAAYSPARPAS
ncbi:hypothetical protein QJS66_22815 [Kocuria rhizophila]|nr:hypothetical protein QJS66_22815 [Kocuria rhizophila]